MLSWSVDGSFVPSSPFAAVTSYGSRDRSDQVYGGPRAVEGDFRTPMIVSQTTPISVTQWRGGRPRIALTGSDPGMVRENNQDSCCVNEDIGLYMVADGMGGRAGGEVASQLAVQVIETEVRSHLDLICSLEVSGRRAFFAQAVNKACLSIYERSLELPQYRGMGTTCTLLWMSPFSGKDEHGSCAIIGHVGDSRCYLVRSGLIFQLTDDHSLVNEQIKAGILEANDPMIEQMRNVITRCVGYQEDEEVDTRELRVFSGDRFLICSDGLSNKVSDEEIRSFLAEGVTSSLPGRLIDLANERGGEDNISVVLVEL